MINPTLLRILKATIRRRARPMVVPAWCLSLCAITLGRSQINYLLSELRRSFPQMQMTLPTAVEELRPFVTKFTLAPESIAFILFLLEKYQPRHIVEFGSGLSTVVLANWCRQGGAERTLVSLEHDPVFLERTQAMLERRGLGSHATLLPYRPEASVVGTADLSGGVDFVLIDGPPRTVGRIQTLIAVSQLLAGGGHMVLDDAFREHEQECLRVWRKLKLIRKPRIVFVPHGMLLATLTGRTVS